MNPDSEILNPKSLIIPTAADFNLMTTAAIGTLVMSGAKLYICVSAGTFELVTSA